MELSELSYERAYQNLVRWACTTARTTHELNVKLDSLEQKFLSQGFEQVDVTKVKTKLKAAAYTLGVFDDQAYATQYVADQVASRKMKSKMQIIAFLSKKGLPKELISKALTQYTPQAEATILANLIKKKYKCEFSQLSQVDKQKAYRYLIQKGFSPYALSSSN